MNNKIEPALLEAARAKPDQLLNILVGIRPGYSLEEVRKLALPQILKVEHVVSSFGIIVGEIRGKDVEHLAGYSFVLYLELDQAVEIADG